MKKFVVLMIVTFGLIVSIFAVFALNRWYPTHGHADWDEVQQFTADKIPVNPKDFRSDFEEIFEQVKKKYPYITRVRDKKRLVKVGNLVKNSYLYR